MLLAVCGAVVGSGYLITENIGDNVKRVPDVFGRLDPAARPAGGTSLTFLLVGTDTRSGDTAARRRRAADTDPRRTARRRADDRAAERRTAPRPPSPRSPATAGSTSRDTGRTRSTRRTPSAGPACCRRPSRTSPQLRIDHFAVIDFAGFQPMVDAVGGIDVGRRRRRRAVTASSSTAGVNHLDGRAGARLRPAALRARRRRPRPRPAPAERAARAVHPGRRPRACSPTRPAPSPCSTRRAQLVSVDDTLSNGGLRTHRVEPRRSRPGRRHLRPRPGGGRRARRAARRPWSTSTGAGPRSSGTSLRDDRVAAYADAAPPTTTLRTVTTR